MPDRFTWLIHHCLDSALWFSTLAAGAITPLLISEAANSAPDNELRLLLLPLLGAMLVSAGMIMLNPNPETRRIVIGRGLFALFFGMLLPQVISMFHPTLAGLGMRPILLLFFGGCCAGVAYVLSKPFTRQFYDRAEGIVRREMDAMERRRDIATNVTNSNTAALHENTVAINDRIAQASGPTEVRVVNPTDHPIPTIEVHE